MWKYIIGLWIAMFGAVFISWLTRTSIILSRAFIVGIILFGFTIGYEIWCGYKFWKKEVR